MRAPRALCGAYDEDMETIILVLLLMLSGDPAFKEKLRAALDFYRENRETLRLIAKLPQEHTGAEENRETKETSSPEKEEDLKVIESFLKNLNG